MGAFKLLIIDDSKYFCRLIQNRLAKLYWDIRIENDVNKALITAREFQPDLIMMDFMRSKISGLQLCEEIRDSCSGVSKTPIIIHSANKTRTDILKAMKAGADSFLVKPASMQTLLKKIDDIMTRQGQPVISSLEMNRVHKSTFTPAMKAERRMAMLVKSARELKAMPHAIHRTLKVADDERTGASELARVIKTDIAISGMVLKRANSVYYGISEPIVNIQEAIVRIGFKETKWLVLGLSVVKNFTQERKTLGFSRKSFWEHSLATATIGQILAERSRCYDIHYVFVAGLLHDIGKMVLDEYAPDDFDQALELAHVTQISIVQAERESFGLTHNEIGQSVLEKWQFPQAIQKAVLYHHNLTEAEIKVIPEDRSLVKMVALADMIAKSMRFGYGGDDVISDCPPEITSLFGLDLGIDDALIDQATADIEEFKVFLDLPDDDVQKSYIGLGGDIKKIYYIKKKPGIVNNFMTYLTVSGCTVEQCGLLEAITAFEQGNPGIIVWDIEADIDMQTVSDSVRDIPGNIPVILLGDKQTAAGWNYAQERPDTPAFSKPVWGDYLLQRIVELQEKVKSG
ncbi:HDOD domain-containing protein [Planctomycetota bacterium]